MTTSKKKLMTNEPNSRDYWIDRIRKLPSTPDEGRTHRDEALERVSRTAFTAAVKDVVESMSGQRVTGEDIRVECACRGVVPHHPNAWGAAINSMVRKNLLIFDNEYKQMKSASSHARKTPVYRVVEEESCG